MRDSIYRALRAINYEGLESYVNEVLEFLSIRLPKTFEALPFQSISQAAVSKILRGFFGVHWYASADSAGGLRLLDTAPGRQDLFELAYSYGASYALIDNLIDTDFFRTPQDRDYFLDVILRAMDGADVATLAPKAPYAKELASLWRNVKPTLERRPLLRSWLTELVRAQRNDASLTHAELAMLPPVEASRVLLHAGMMKASWTRICAKAIATDKGFADPDCVLFAGLNNQLSNDLEGLASDNRFGAVTTFTHLLRTHRTEFDAFGMMLSCAAHSINYMSQHFEFNDSALVDAFVLRLLESAAELQSSVGPDRYRELLDRLSDLSPGHQSRQLVSALSSIGPTPPVAHQEMLLLSGADDYALRLWLQRRDHRSTAHRLLVDASERHGVALERFIQNTDLSPCARYAMTGDCGRFRPYLLLVLSGLVGLTDRQAMAYAVAIECFHSASLILDDLPAQDNADMRRGKPTAHLAYGEAIAQLAVVELIALGFSLIGRPTNAPGHHGGRLVEEAHRCLAGPEGLCHGQLRDLGTQGQDLATDDWASIAKAKTGQPLLFCILVPLIASGASREVEALSEMGLDLGVLFQVRDDLADRPNAQRTEQLREVAAYARKRCADWATPPGEPWDAVHRFLVSLAEEMHDQIDRYCTPDADKVAASLDQPLWGYR